MDSHVPLGHLIMTNGVSDAMVEMGERFIQFVHFSISRHERCDWGDVDDHDRHHNDWALKAGARILSVYELPDEHRPPDKVDDRLWIITEADRSVSTVLWPGEY